MIRFFKSLNPMRRNRTPANQETQTAGRRTGTAQTQANPPPARPTTPTYHYQARTPQDMAAARHYDQLVRANQGSIYNPESMPGSPAGRLPMTPEEAAATRMFREDYARLPPSATAHQEFFNSYRRVPAEGQGQDHMEANFPGLHPGGATSVAEPSGTYRAGTKVVIHSHPNNTQPGASENSPSLNDHYIAHRARTNTLMPPGTQVDRHLMYYPPEDKFFGYSGALGSDGSPRFHELYDPADIPRPAATTSQKALPPTPPSPSRPASIASDKAEEG